MMSAQNVGFTVSLFCEALPTRHNIWNSWRTSGSLLSETQEENKPNHGRWVPLFSIRNSPCVFYPGVYLFSISD